MQLLQHLFELLRNRKAEVGGVLQDGEAVIGDRPEDDRRAQDSRLVQHMDVQHLSKPDYARKMPITYDEDCPETTPEMAMRFRRVNPVRKVMS